eukprot:1352365-Pleurochrysis_carterae.AAC.1
MLKSQKGQKSLAKSDINCENGEGGGKEKTEELDGASGVCARGPVGGDGECASGWQTFIFVDIRLPRSPPRCSWTLLRSRQSAPRCRSHRPAPRCLSSCSALRILGSFGGFAWSVYSGL